MVEWVSVWGGIDGFGRRMVNVIGCVRCLDVMRSSGWPRPSCVGSELVALMWVDLGAY